MSSSSSVFLIDLVLELYNTILRVMFLYYAKVRKSVVIFRLSNFHGISIDLLRAICLCSESTSAARDA